MIKGGGMFAEKVGKITALALGLAAVSSVFLGESPTAYAPGLHERHVRLTAALAALAEGLAR